MVGGVVAVVTAGDTGIGATFATALVKAGARVAMAYSSDHERASRVSQSIGNSENVFAIRMDPNEEASVETLFSAMETRFGAARILIHIIGSALANTLAHNPTVDNFDRAVRSDWYGPFLATRRFSRALEAEAVPGYIIYIFPIAKSLEPDAKALSNSTASQFSARDDTVPPDLLLARGAPVGLDKESEFICDTVDEGDETLAVVRAMLSAAKAFSANLSVSVEKIY